LPVVEEAGDRAIARIAAAQHGIVTRKQLLAAGLGHGAIDHRLTQLRLHPVHRGVYLVGHPLPPPMAREMAAILACGRDAVASHDTAGGIWGFRSPKPGRIDITVLSRCCRSRPGVRLHSTNRIDARDVRRADGIPLTAPSRTLLDLAGSLTPSELAHAFEQARIMRLVRPDDLTAALERFPGRRGTAAIRRLLDSNVRPAFTRSEAEARLLTLLRAAGLAPTAVNTCIVGREVDMLWRPEHLVVEVDGFAYHASRRAFERDRLRDAELQAAGYRVMRVTWRHIQNSPESVIARIAQALALSSPWTGDR
jgi:very-short-patch-repair endonuclease